MNIHLILNLPTTNNKQKKIIIGHPKTKEELDQMYRFRYEQYIKKGYIAEGYFNDQRDYDEYDKEQKCIYFIAKVEDRVIGTVRLVVDKYLPTEKDCFDFNEPGELMNIKRTERVEFSRLIIVPYEKDIYFPRHMILLALFYVIMAYCKEHGFKGGYSFIKDKLHTKLSKQKVPIHFITNFKQKYQKKILQKYFSDPNDPVCPIYFLTDEVNSYIKKVFYAYFKQESEKEVTYKPSIIKRIFLVAYLISK